MLTYVSNSENDTKNFAKKMASNLKTGDVIVLSGDLGSGKTKFTEGVLDFFGLADDISSPTFTIVNEHPCKDTTVYHFDVYRLSDVDEFYAIGGEEYLSNGICIIEWGEIIESILPPNYLKIVFRKADENDSIRYLDFYPYGLRFEKILEGMF